MGGGVGRNEREIVHVASNNNCVKFERVFRKIHVGPSLFGKLFVEHFSFRMRTHPTFFDMFLVSPVVFFRIYHITKSSTRSLRQQKIE
jgi:hypothetical protein